MVQARSLKFLDVSETVWDRRGIEFFVQALNSTPIGEGKGTVDGANGVAELQSTYSVFLPPTPLLKDSDLATAPAAVQSIRMDNCGLRAGTLDALGELLTLDCADCSSWRSLVRTETHLTSP